MQKAAPPGLVTSLRFYVIALIAMMTANGCMQEAVVPFDIHDSKTESAILNLKFQRDLHAERELGECLMEYHIGPERFVACRAEDRSVIALSLPGEPCEKISSSTAGAYEVAVQPNEPDLASVILSHSIALSVDKIIVPLLLSDSGPRHEHATALARELLKQNDLVVTGRLKYGSKFTGSLRLTDEGRWQLLNALGMSARK